MVLASQRRAGWVFGLGVGLLVAFVSYRWLIDPSPRIERQLQESAVMASRVVLLETLGRSSLDIVDPLAPDRVIGKVYVYRANEGWEVSGFYRRNADDLWHPYLMTLDGNNELAHLKVSDRALLDRAAEPKLEVLP
jgi:hypothetical protein